MRLAIVLLTLLLCGCANGLFYFPDRIDYEPRLLRPVPHEDVWIDSSDGLRLHGWWLRPEGEVKGTVLHLHGNAQNLTAHVAYVDWLPAAGYQVLTIDYRGYGLSSGRPDRKGLQRDVAAAWAWLRQHPDVNPERLILLGQSLGAANALRFAGSRPPGLRAVVADSPFAGYGRIGREKLLQIPLLGWVLWPLSPLIISDGLSPEPVVSQIAPVPLLLMHGDRDATIPFHHSERLYRRAREPRLLWRLEGAGHTEALGRYRPRVQPRLEAFLEYALSGDAGRLLPEDRAALR